MLKMKKTDGKVIGEQIRQRRMELGYTQEKLAELCGVSTSYLGHIERGSRLMSVSMLVILSDVLKISTDRILFNSFTDQAEWSHIQSLVESASPQKKQAFFKAVRILAENIEKL